MRTYGTRLQMMRDLLGEAPAMLEIGVFRGDFAKEILDCIKPSTLFLCDPWDCVSVSGDADGNNVQQVDLRVIYQNLVHHYEDDTRVHILRGHSPFITKSIPDSCLDCVYIDGDHSYNGCRTDLYEAMRMVRRGGWIMGHDYMMNPMKTSAWYEFGVRQAVDEFCSVTGLRIHALGLDGCVSYAIRVE